MEPQIYPADRHEIDPSLLDPDALWVIQRLREAGFTAYLVGGSVRDLLAKTPPKDFDVSTSALPDEVKRVFGRRCLLIGRRFRLAHIRFGHKVIEVSTFRSGENADELIVRDNVWGTPEEDVLRRDFTINGMFYDPENHAVIDYVGGWKDIHNKLIRSIGDPVVRFKQDPVRMIRLLKFKARFGYNICEESQRALETCVTEITKSAPARILEEMLRMLESGYATPFLNLMMEWNLLNQLFPSLNSYLLGPEGHFILEMLKVADQLNQNRDYKSLDRAVLTSCLLYPILESTIKRKYLDHDQIPHMGHVIMTTNATIQDFVTASFSHFPKRLSTSVAYILSTQYRLTPLNQKRHPKKRMLDNKEFPLALQLLKLRSLINGDLLKTYSTWRHDFRQQHHHTPPAQRPYNQPKRRHHRHARRR